MRNTRTSEGITFPMVIGEALLAFASKDTTRPVIWGVGLDDEGNLAATDGHTALRFHGHSAKDEPSDAACSIWPLDYVTAQVKVAKALKSDVTLLWSKRSGFRFPPLTQVIPPYGVMGSSESIGLNATYLARLAKVTKALDADGVALETTNSPLDPILFTVHAREHGVMAEVVIMPMRIRCCGGSHAETRRAA